MTVSNEAFLVTLDAKNAEISRLRDALRKVAIVKTYRPNAPGGSVFVKAQCEICDAECGPDQMIVHVGDCPLTVLNQS